MTPDGAVFLTACAMTGLDIISGMLVAKKNGEFKSSIMRDGLYHKSASMIIIILSVILDFGQKYVDIGYYINLLLPACLYIIGMECVSIKETIKKLNPQINVDEIIHSEKENKND